MKYTAEMHFYKKSIFCIFTFHGAVLSLGSSNFTLVYPYFGNSANTKIHFTFILLHYQTFIIQNEDRIWPTVFTIFNSFQPSKFIFQLYFVSDYDITCI